MVYVVVLFIHQILQQHKLTDQNFGLKVVQDISILIEVQEIVEMTFHQYVLHTQWN
jgi:hypothetical protein